MCTGWCVGNQIYPVFQKTRHIKRLNQIRKELRNELECRYVRYIRRVYIMLRKIPEITIDIIPTIMEFNVGSLDILKTV
jgi:hypothetical protein